MKKIIVCYWYSQKLKDITGIEPNQEYEYSLEKRIEIVDLILKKGLNIMLYQVDVGKTLIMWIDDKKFQQR